MNSKDHNEFTKTVEHKVIRKLKAQNNPSRSVWMGLGTMGIVGWSVAVPTLVGLFLGIWLDKHYSFGFSSTLNLLIVGIVFGCFSAWRWVLKESKSIHKDEKND
jgi:ATP synthase protein I